MAISEAGTFTALVLLKESYITEASIAGRKPAGEKLILIRIKANSNFVVCQLLRISKENFVPDQSGGINTLVVRIWSTAIECAMNRHNCSTQLLY